MATAEAQVEKMAADAADDYRNLAFAIASGAEKDSEEIRQVVLAAGFSIVHDLPRHARLAENRYMWAVGDKARIAELSGEAGTHRTRAVELNKEMDRLKREYEEAINLLIPEHREATERFKSLQGRAYELVTAAKLGLRRTLPAGWSEKLEWLAKKHQVILEALPSLQTRRGQLEPKLANLKSLEYRIDNATSPQVAVAARADLHEARAAKIEYDNLSARVRTIQADAQAAQSQLDAHCQTQFDWRCVDFLTEAAEAEARANRRRGMHYGSPGNLISD